MERSITANHRLGQATAHAQEGGAKGFSGDRTGGEHGSGVTAASVPRSVAVLQLAHGNSRRIC